MEERTSGGHPEAAGRDCISSLPEEIIHNILDRLHAPRKIAKLSFLSKRWNHLWLSYPVLKFDEYDFRSASEFENWNVNKLFDTDTVYAPIEPLQGFAAALLRKLSHPAAAISAVRIILSSSRWDPKVCSGFLDGVIDRLASSSSSSTQKIDIIFGYDTDFEEIDPCDYIAYNVSQGLLQLHSLKVLKLAFCDFRLYGDNDSFAGLGTCLELLELDHVSFPDVRILNGMIAGSPRLKTLLLYSVFGTGGFQVRNHPNLKILKAYRMIGDSVEITGCHSLQILKLDRWEKGELQVSSTPNLEELYIQNEYSHEITDSQLHKFIREFQSIELIWLTKVPPVTHLKFVNSDKLREVQLSLDKVDDARRLINFVNAVVDRRFLTAARHQSFVQTPLHFDVSCDINFQELKQFLRELCQFRVTLEFGRCELFREPLEDEFPTPIIELVQFGSFLVLGDSFLDMLLHTCHPKALSMSERHHFQYLCERFMERSSNDGCTRACECWRHQLKDVKIIKSVSNGEIKEDEELDISDDVLSSFIYEKQIMFALTWR